MIKNIIFDLGGVLLNIDFSLSIEAFRKLGIENIDEIFSGYVQNKFFDSYDKGNISDDDFVEELKKYIPRETSTDKILNAWNAMILDFPEDRIRLLQSLKKKYRLFLLSNTNSLHFPVYNKQLKDKFEISDLSDLFEKAYYSYRLHMRKPDTEIFRLVVNENELIPEETLFVDDSPKNIEMANELGLHTMLFRQSEDLAKALQEIQIG